MDLKDTATNCRALVVEAAGQNTYRHLVVIHVKVDGAALVLDAGAHDVLEQLRRAMGEEGLVPPGAAAAASVNASAEQ